MSDASAKDADETPTSAWGQAISAERTGELQEWLARWNGASDHSARRGPFDEVALTGADVFWLAEHIGRDTTPSASTLHLEGANLRRAHLEGSNLSWAQLGEANLSWAQLQGADLAGAQLGGANFNWAHLERANLLGAHLERASLFRAQLDGANLSGTHLEDADLRNTSMNKRTQLNDAALNRASLDQVSFDGANLAVVDWDAVHVLGDEVQANAKKNEDGTRVNRATSRGTLQAAVRTHLQLAAVMRSQGMAEQADRFAYRAQILQRKAYAHRLPRRLGAWLFSWVLYLLAGYGYRPVRTLFWYLVTLASFTFLFMQATHGWVPFGLPTPSQQAPLPWYEALILSVSSFHGRGFFQPLESLGDPLAALEAVSGLFIEIAFIATFTQRYFGQK